MFCLCTSAAQTTQIKLNCTSVLRILVIQQHTLLGIFRYDHPFRKYIMYLLFDTFIKYREFSKVLTVTVYTYRPVLTSVGSSCDSCLTSCVASTWGPATWTFWYFLASCKTKQKIPSWLWLQRCHFWIVLFTYICCYDNILCLWRLVLKGKYWLQMAQHIMHLSALVKHRFKLLLAVATMKMMAKAIHYDLVWTSQHRITKLPAMALSLGVQYGF